MYSNTLALICTSNFLKSIVFFNFVTKGNALFESALFKEVGNSALFATKLNTKIDHMFTKSERVKTKKKKAGKTTLKVKKLYCLL